MDNVIRGQITTDQNEILYPETSSDMVTMEDGKSLEASINDLSLRTEIGEILDFGYFKCIISTSTPSNTPLQLSFMNGNIVTEDDECTIKLKKGKYYIANINYYSAIASGNFGNIFIYDKNTNEQLTNLNSVKQSFGGDYTSPSGTSIIIEGDRHNEIMLKICDASIRSLNLDFTIHEIGRTLIKDPLLTAQERRVEYGSFKGTINSSSPTDTVINLTRLNTNIDISDEDITNKTIPLKKDSTYKISAEVYCCSSTDWGNVALKDNKGVILDSSKSINTGYTGGSYVCKSGMDTIVSVKDADYKIFLVVGLESTLTEAEVMLNIQEIKQPVIVELTKEISNPLTNEPIEYGSFIMSKDQTTNILADNHIEFDTVISGNMTLSTGTGQDNGCVNLKAGKTYRITLNIAAKGTNTGMIFGVYNNDENTYIGPLCFGVTADNSGGYLSSTNSDFIYTPTKNCTITANIQNPNTLSCIMNTTTILNVQEIKNQSVNQYGGFMTKVLFEGSAGAVGEYTLTDDINNYDFVMLFANCTDGTYSSTVVPVVDIPSYNDMGHPFAVGHYYSNGYSYILRVRFTAKDKMYLVSGNTVGFSFSHINKIIGIKGELPSIFNGGEF